MPPIPGGIAASSLGSKIEVHTIATSTVPKKRASATAVAKEYPPHEHFGSPLNICRVCGAKYSYVPKPYDHAGSNQ